MSSSKAYPSPLVIPPLQNDDHTHTIILLHGRGSNSERFGRVFIEATGIAKRLPTVKFVFPTASKRRSTVLKRVPINQWFDNYSLEDPNTRTELQLDGLWESSAFLRRLVDEEAGILARRKKNGGNVDVDVDAAAAVGGGDDDGYSRVVIGGLSQGCAASVFCLLGGLSSHGERQRLGGFIGMSGWLPLEREIAGILKMDNGGQGQSDDGDEDEDDPFAHDSDGDDIPAHIQAVNHVREVLELPPIEADADELVSHLKTPVFLGHGSLDEKVSVNLGRRMAAILSDGFGMDVTWKAYENLGHWYEVPTEIDDAIQFLQEKAGFPVVE